MTEKEENVVQRQEKLRQEITRNPFVTDEELAAILNVSIYTIRADRRKMDIPDVRRRTLEAATSIYGQAKSLIASEITGDLLEVELDRDGLSLLEITSEMVGEKSGIVRGHILFAQANSLANAIVDADIALTTDVKIKFLAPVRTGERTLAKARMVKKEGRKREVEVMIKTQKEVVFQGTFLIFGLSEEGARHLNIYHNEGEAEK